jgi:hypothetical protein
MEIGFSGECLLNYADGKGCEVNRRTTSPTVKI